eukprot:6186885-Pleurochrysis_carterae.AAC.2
MPSIRARGARSGRVAVACHFASCVASWQQNALAAASAMVDSLLVAASKALRELTASEHALLWLPPVCYIVLVPICRLAMQSKTLANTILSLRGMHNALLAIYSAAASVSAFQALSKRPLSVHGMLCEAVEPMPWMVYTWYVSKLYEWVDSVLLLAAGKGLTSLHYNHHMTTATVVASHFVGRAVRTSIFDIPLLLNAVVHTMMYAYYWWPSLLLPVKQLLTQMQILQHVTVLAAILYTTAVWSSEPSRCDINPFANGLSLSLYLMYLVQFLLFYFSAYGRKSRAPSASKAE